MEIDELVVQAKKIKKFYLDYGKWTVLPKNMVNLHFEEGEAGTQFDLRSEKLDFHDNKYMWQVDR